MEPLSIAAGMIRISHIPRTAVAQGRMSPWYLDEKNLNKLIKALVTCPETSMRLTRALNSLISADIGSTTQFGEHAQTPERRIQRRPPQTSTALPANQTLQQASGTYQAPERPKKCIGCSTMHLPWTITVATSLAIGLWRSLSTGDEGKGFTVAAYIFAVGSALVFQIQNRHRERCLRAVGSQVRDDIV